MNQSQAQDGDLTPLEETYLQQGIIEPIERSYSTIHNKIIMEWFELYSTPEIPNALKVKEGNQLSLIGKISSENGWTKFYGLQTTNVNGNAENHTITVVANFAGGDPRTPTYIGYIDQPIPNKAKSIQSHM